MSEMPSPQPTTPVEITDDTTTLRVIIQEMVKALNGPTGRPSSRQRSLAVTKLEEAYLWLGEDFRINC